MGLIMKNLKQTDIVQKGYVAYAVKGGKIEDLMVIPKSGGYDGKCCQELVDDGWHFVCSGKKYKIGAKTKRQPWPKSYQLAKQDSTITLLSNIHAEIEIVCNRLYRLKELQGKIMAHMTKLLKKPK